MKSIAVTLALFCAFGFCFVLFCLLFGIFFFLEKIHNCFVNKKLEKYQFTEPLNISGW